MIAFSDGKPVPTFPENAPDRSFHRRRRRRRIGVAAAVEVLDLIASRAAARADEIARPDRRLAMAAGNVEHVGRLAEAREAAAQRAHQRLALLDAGAPMGGAGGEV